MEKHEELSRVLQSINDSISIAVKHGAQELYWRLIDSREELIRFQDMTRPVAGRMR